ncbi:hypothetical protein F4781DRAFT_224973 [Annulohypoxylon bovei var. microspora]|nr:hypothetical protein F4781DRAFT_224973 [Annulohypoxylon bovei var. microspora]
MSNESGNRPTRRDYDTGFPDAFAEYTTSLRHPEANVSPGACISAEDIDPSKTLHRTRRSFLARHKHAVTHGIISNGSNSKRTSRSTLILPTIDSAVDVGDLKHTDTNGSIGNSSKDGTDSLHGDCSLSLTASNEDDFTDDGRQRIKLFRKWRSQKD